MGVTLYKITGIMTTYMGVSDTYENAIKRFCYIRDFELIAIDKTVLGKVVGFRFTKKSSRSKIVWRFSIERYNPDF